MLSRGLIRGRVVKAEEEGLRPVFQKLSRLTQHRNKLHIYSRMFVEGGASDQMHPNAGTRTPTPSYATRPSRGREGGTM